MQKQLLTSAAVSSQPIVCLDSARLSEYKLDMANKNNAKALSSNQEDYLETIMLLDDEQEVVRVKDVASKMGVKKPSVVSALKSLTEKGMVEHEHYGYIRLTTSGRKVAEGVYHKHRLLYEFFTRVLDVDEETADSDACSLEHHISNLTKDRLIKFIEFVNNFPKQDREAQWLLNFKGYLKTGKVELCSKFEMSDDTDREEVSDEPA